MCYGDITGKGQLHAASKKASYVAAIEEFPAHHQQERGSGSLFQASPSASFELLKFGDRLLLHMQPHG